MATETQTKPADLRRKRITREHFDWTAWYREHLCECSHVDQIHGKGGCEGLNEEDGPCPCQGFTQKEAANG